MATPAQLHANRLNAQRSTGPRSEEGKAASRFNALEYGIEARSLVIPGEDPAELEALALEYHQQFNAVGPLERFLVDTLVRDDWNRRRYTRIEAQVLKVLLAGQDAAAGSSLVVNMVSGVQAPAAMPVCGALRGEPCRPYAALGNQG